MGTSKQALRKTFLEKRLALSEGAYLQLNRQLCDLFFASVDLLPVRVLHSFLPVTEKKEPDTWLIIDRLQREFPHVRISIPKVSEKVGQLEHFYFEGLGQLQKSNWGISEPGNGVPTPVEKIDMVLVPLLAFDKNGNRIGYGKGFYDKFLSECRADCRKIGISLFPPVEIEIPVNDSDVPLDSAITPSGIFSF
jgi:5-formyltetrahydrofolate cyclo-ligase